MKLQGSTGKQLLGGILVVSTLLLSGCDLFGDDDDDDDDPITLQLVADGFIHPVMLVESPDDSGRLFVVDQAGTIRIIMPDGTVLQQPFLDVRSKIVALTPQYDERGLLGLAFHPDYEQNGRFYVYYTAPLRNGAPAGWDHTNTIAEYTVSTNENVADAASEEIVLLVDQPQPNHSAGTLAFGPDDFLYISLGDGGGRDDEGDGPPQNTPVLGHVADWYDANAGGNGQDITQNLLGSILRIDVDGGTPYAIPPTNPFVGNTAGLDEIYAYGFRNPYRFSFDMGGQNMLLVGDAGQELYEEVSMVTRGGNYGWNVKEGTHCFDSDNPTTVPAACPDEDPDGVPLVDPVIEFANAKNDGLGLVVVGGYVYRGDDVDRLSGDYLFGVASRDDGQGGAVFMAQPRSTSGMWSFERLTFDDDGGGFLTTGGDLNDFLLSFGQDSEGEMYLLTASNLGPSGTTGKVFRITSGD